jgi:L-iditol 2-dehydrogenase
MLGHESVGKVVEIGSEVVSYKIGDIVMLPYNDPNPEIYGTLGSAWGAYSEYGIVTDAVAFADEIAPEVAYAQQILPTDIDPVDGAMIVTLREVLSNIKYFGIQKEDSVVVYGSGPVALTFINLMSLLGIKNIIGVARREEKKNNLLEMGATVALNSKKCDIISEVRKIFPNGVKYVLDAVGSPEVVNQAMELICDRGEILCYGVPKVEMMEIDWSKAPYNWKLNFQQMPSKVEEGQAFAQILEWIRSGKLDLKDYISDYFDFDNIFEGMAKLQKHELAKKGIIVYK